MESNYWALIVTLNLLFATDVSSEKKRKLKAKVDALDSFVRSELHFLKESIETDRQERKELVQKLNQTLELLELSTGDRTDKTPVDTNNGGIQSQLNALSEKMEQNNNAISQLAELQIHTRRGFMEEKEARKSDANATVTELIQIQKVLNDHTRTQQEIINNQNSLVNTVTVTQNEIITNQDDMANNIIVIRTKTDALPNTTGDLRDKSDMLQQKLESEVSKCATTTDNSTQKLVLQVSDTAQAVEEVKQNTLAMLYCNNQLDLDTCLQRHFANTLQQIHTLIPVRLVGGTNQYEGRVEIFYQGRHGTVCDDYWDNDNARVVCRMLGFTGGTAFYGPGAIHGHNFGEGTGEILLTNVACTGDELSLFACSHRGIGIHGCVHDEDAGVRCDP